MAGIASGLRKVRNVVFGFLGAGKHGQTSGGDESSGDAALDKAGEAGESTQRLNYHPRRYKRALLLTGRAGTQNQIASAAGIFRGKEYPVADLSHSGVAIERVELPESELPDATNPESIQLTLGLLEPFTVQVTLARHSERDLAFEFVEVSTDGRLAIDRFLDPKMIGLNMRQVDRAFFSPGETFTVWFCGPRDTNFFLWMNGGQLERAIVQLGDDQFTLAPSAGAGTGIRFVRHNSVAGGNSTDTELRDSVLFALDVALQVKSGGESIAGLVKLLTEAADRLQARS